jgi:GNAT superfamily N-acetyltransferase
MPELVERRWRPLQNGRLYRAEVAEKPPADEPPGPTFVRAFDPARLAGDLLPLLVAATENPTAAFPPPDAAEAAFLLRLLPGGLVGLLAEVDGTPAGFVLLGADNGPRQRATRGSRSLWRRGLWAVTSRVAPAGRTDAGRVFFGGVLPAYRRRGIGGQLWRHSLDAAAGQGWRALTIGPVWQPPRGESPVAAFLAGRATARQAYTLYEWSF